MSIAIKTEGLSKAYQLGQFSTGTLSRDIERWWALMRGKQDPFLKIGDTNDRTKKGSSDIVWSLKDINFEIEQGSAVGVIGRNGAGKSTLLKVLSKVTSPTSGNVKIKGRIASLLEVGTGFHPELTGRENIFLNGAILGMRKKEIERKFDEIVDFAGVERYIDTPVKRYSSGMYVRLAFAVAVNLDCEILIVDEVLAVGDADFQKKSLSKLDNINTAHEKTVLFVSHNTQLIRNLCKKAILLENGIMKEYGNVDDVVATYVSNTTFNRATWSGSVGDDNIQVIKSSVNEHSPGLIRTSEPLIVKLMVKVYQKIDMINFSFTVNSSFNYPLMNVLFNDFNDMNGIDVGTYELVFEIPPYFLASGGYDIQFWLSYPNIRKIETSECDLSFELVADTIIGNRYFASNSPTFNSIVRPNLFKGLFKID